MNCGIYTITSPSGKLYLGSAVNFTDRWNLHLSNLRTNTHHNKPLQRAFDKYGEDGLVFKKLLICEKKDLLIYEQRAMDILRPEYNIAKIAGSLLGTKRTPLQNAEKSILLKGRKGRPLSLEAKEKAIAVLHSPESRAKAREKLRTFENRLKNSERESVKIICVETNQIFKSMQKAGQWCVEKGLTFNSRAFIPISKAIKRNGTSFGYHWKLLEDSK